MAFKQTPSQTIGPFFAYGLTSEQYGYQLDQIAGGNLLAGGEDVDGERIRIVGRVFDGEGMMVGDAMVEIWQADAHGRFSHPSDHRGSNSAFTGFGRFGTGAGPRGRFEFDTIKPGPVAEGQAPHIGVVVFARGLLSHLYTRIYFDDEVERNVRDPVLSALPEERRRTLIAAREVTAAGIVYTFNIRLQGADETVFFDL